MEMEYRYVWQQGMLGFFLDFLVSMLIYNVVIIMLNGLPSLLNPLKPYV